MAEVYIKDLPVHPELKDDDYILIEGDTTDKIRYKDFADAVANKSDPVFLWRDGTWDDIAYWLRKHDNGDINIYDYIKVGDVKEVPISAIPAAYGSEAKSAQTVKMIIADKNVVNLASGEKCHFVVQCSDVGKCRVHSQKGTIGAAIGWENLLIRQWGNNAFKNALPTKLQAMIKISRIKSLTKGGDSTVKTTEDNVFLPARINVLGRSTDTPAFNNEDVGQWEFYKTWSNTAIIGDYWSSRTIDKMNSDEEYKLAGFTKNNYYVLVPFTSDTQGTAPCFCI